MGIRSLLSERIALPYLHCSLSDGILMVNTNVRLSQHPALLFILICSGSRGARIFLSGLNCQSENSQNIRRLGIKFIVVKKKVFSQFFFSVDKVCMYVAC